MHGDVLYILDEQRELTNQIVEKILKLKKNKPVIAIGGESGSGKSVIAHLIASELKKQKIYTKILHTDNYYKIPPEKRAEWRKQNGMESINYTEYDWNLIKKNISDFKENRESMLPFLDLLTDQKDKLITNFNKIQILILEGLYSLHSDADLKVFIDLTYNNTKTAQIIRSKEILNDFRLKVLKREHVVVRSFKPLADVIIDKNYKAIDSIRK